MSGYNGGAFILLLVLASPSNKALVCVETHGFVRVHGVCVVDMEKSN